MIMALQARPVAVEVPPSSPPCATRLPFSCIRSLSASTGNAGRFPRQKRVFCSLQEQVILADRMPVGEPAYWSWLHQNSSESDVLGGWSTVGSSDSHWIKGILQLGAGVVLAVAFALVSHSALSRKGSLYQHGSPVTRQEEYYISPTPDSSSMKKNTHRANSKELKTQQFTRKLQRKEDESSRDESASNVHENASNTVRETFSKLVVAGFIEPEHDKALSVLQTLKVVEPSSKPNELCTRREYARWLVLASNILARKPSERIFPAMFIEGVTNIAFNDIWLEDPDFPYIQGLAEAGLVRSKLSFNDSKDTDSVASTQNIDKASALFWPDSPVCREDVVSWKTALEHPYLSSFDEETAEAKSGYVDIRQIHKTVRSAVLMDLLAGEKGITASAFGYTRRFQPEHPVTKGQAAVAITTGETAMVVSEKIARLQAENLAQEAVLKELASEARARKELDAEFKEVLASVKESRIATEKIAEATSLEFERVKAERQNEALLLEREKAAVESAMKLLSRTREGLNDKLQVLSMEETKVQLEKKRLEKLKLQAEKMKQDLLCARSKLEAETRAVILARVWTEDEAKRAHAHADILVQAKKHWEIRGTCYCYQQIYQPEKHSEEKSLHGRLEKREGTDFGGLQLVLQFSRQAHAVAQQKTVALLREAGEKTREMQSTLSNAAQKVKELREAFASTLSLVSTKLQREGVSLLMDVKELKSLWKG